MPKTQSAKKALRQSARRRERNLKRQKKLQASIKSFKKLLAAKKTEEAKQYLPQVYKSLDKMAKVNLIKTGKASRLKSRLARKLGNR